MSITEPQVGTIAPGMDVGPSEGILDVHEARPLRADIIKRLFRNKLELNVAQKNRLLREIYYAETFTVEEMRLYKRLTLVASSGTIVKVFYPVFPHDRNAEEVLAWLRQAA